MQAAGEGICGTAFRATDKDGQHVVVKSLVICFTGVNNTIIQGLEPLTEQAGRLVGPIEAVKELLISASIRSSGGQAPAVKALSAFAHEIGEGGTKKALKLLLVMPSAGRDLFAVKAELLKAPKVSFKQESGYKANRHSLKVCTMQAAV